MPSGFRLCKSRYAPSTPENARRAGDGAARVGGRWNSPEVRAVYTSGSISLAVLEVLVHSPLELPDDYQLWKIDLPYDFSDLADLPDDWQCDDYTTEVQELGSEYLAESAVVRVPSVVVPRSSITS
jgi:RES domain-containing protein